MPKQIVGPTVIENDGTERHGLDHRHAARIAAASVESEELPGDWKIGETVLRCPDRKVGLLIRAPLDCDDRVGVQVPGEENIRWVEISKLRVTSNAFFVAACHRAYDGEEGARRAKEIETGESLCVLIDMIGGLEKKEGPGAFSKMMAEFDQKAADFKERYGES